MIMKYKVNKTALTYEEKKERVTFYNADTGSNEDVEAFCKREIYEETVDMICKKCKYVETIEHDILLEMTWGMKIPQMECPECNGTMKPELI